jgi:hypothetical protein
MGPRYAALPSTIPVEPFSPPFHLSFHCFFLDRLPLVEKLLPFGQPEINLDLPIGKVELQRDHGVSPLFDLSDKPPDLPLMKEEFSSPQRFMIHAVGLGIRIDMGIHKEDLAPLNIGVTIPEVDPSFPKRLDLRPQEGNPCLVGLLNGVVKKGLFVLTDQFFAHRFILHEKALQRNEMTSHFYLSQSSQRSRRKAPLSRILERRIRFK